ncbi:hypothetical protein BDP55DRAFT_413530 [Colletotrichum godetiae]|uniref:Uncharacterized protein n=1 Tax=Colletotrichum godetiae TaxID=1209918 RepID=A0AAJ0ASQ0_9PEZI|nr:uncharacterized protein BDP55DRAFT_413530 [Colletotrichum godetiae]KAK1689673.1 hypothetical protein BDP55DRAFT_413530 [Colletotrichum godetiae]
MGTDDLLIVPGYWQSRTHPVCPVVEFPLVQISVPKHTRVYPMRETQTPVLDSTGGWFLPLLVSVSYFLPLEIHRRRAYEAPVFPCARHHSSDVWRRAVQTIRPKTPKRMRSQGPAFFG